MTTRQVVCPVCRKRLNAEGQWTRALGPWRCRLKYHGGGRCGCPRPATEYRYCSDKCAKADQEHRRLAREMKARPAEPRTGDPFDSLLKEA